MLNSTTNTKIHNYLPPTLFLTRSLNYIYHVSPLHAGNSLVTLTFHLLNQYGLLELFQLDMVKLWRFLVMVQEDYHSLNPYHNAVHAADVTQAMYCYLREPKVSNRAIIPLYRKYSEVTYWAIDHLIPLS
jgi:hypothetical protein